MEKLIKENFIFFVIVLAVIVAGIYFVFSGISSAIGSTSELKAKQEELVSKQQKLEEIKKQKEIQKVQKKKQSNSGKIIYEVPGQQFSPEASFGIMFENILANMTNSGLRIRSIEYNYQPIEDKILQTNARGYNACELSFLVVSDYAQLQTFMKNIAKENYLTNVSELYMKPYDKDKSILITRFKIRLYTKTI